MPEQDRVWRRGLSFCLAGLLRKNESERVDHKAYVTLPKSVREMTRQLARHPRRLAPEHVLRECERMSLPENVVSVAFDTPLHRLRLAERTGGEPSARNKLRMRNQAAMSESAVLAPLVATQSGFHIPSDESLPDAEFEKAMKSPAGKELFPAAKRASGLMNEFEGYAHEGAAEEYAQSRDGYDWTFRGRVLSSPPQENRTEDGHLFSNLSGWRAGRKTEIDVGARNPTEDGGLLKTFGSCKHDPRRQGVRQTPAKLSEFAQRFDQVATGNRHAEPLRQMPVLPEWPAELPGSMVLSGLASVTWP